MSKSRSLRTFNLVTSLAPPPVQLLPQAQLPPSHSANLFASEAAEPKKVIRFEESRAFEYCGVKELKAYYQRARRTSKEKRRDTVPMSLGYSRCSAVSRKEDELCSKWQIIEKVEGRLEKGNLNLSALSRVEASPSGVLRARGNYQLYKEKWEKRSRRAELAKGFPSILRVATESRSLCLKKELGAQAFRKENINSRMWATVLREERELKDVYDRAWGECLEREGSWGLAGRSKLEAERQWVCEKGDEGYRFQLLKESAPPP